MRLQQLAPLLLFACAACVTLAVIATTSTYVVVLDTAPLIGETDDFGYGGSSATAYYTEVPPIGSVANNYGYGSLASNIPDDGVQGNPLVGSGNDGIRAAASSIFSGSVDDDFVDPTRVVPLAGHVHNEPRRLYGADASLGPDAIPALGHVVNKRQPWWYEKYGPDGSSALLEDDSDNAWQQKYLAKKRAVKSGSEPAEWLFSFGGNKAERTKPKRGRKNDGYTPQERLRKWVENGFSEMEGDR